VTEKVPRFVVTPVPVEKVFGVEGLCVLKIVFVRWKPLSTDILLVSGYALRFEGFVSLADTLYVDEDDKGI
jgi:hypothetical protein